MVLVGAVAASCGNNNEDYFINLDKYSFESMSKIDVDLNDVSFVDIDRLGINYPYNMVCVNSNRIAIRDKDHNSQIKIIDLDGKLVDKLIPIGEAPNEMLRVNSMSQYDGCIWFGSSFDNKFGRIILQKDSLELEVLGKTNYPFLYAIPHDDKGLKIMTCPAIPDKKRFIITDLNSQISNTVGQFPLNCYDVNNAILQGEATLSADGSRVIALDKSWGIIEIYNNDDFSTISMTQGPDKVASRIVVKEQPTGIRYGQSPMYTVLSGLSVAKDVFYVGYKGFCEDQPETRGNGISRILKYDYQGKPLAYYQLPFHLLSFTTDSNGDMLYGIQEDIENETMNLVKIKL